jgi:hypothetical protein
MCRYTNGITLVPQGYRHLLSATTKASREPLLIDQALCTRVNDGEVPDRSVAEKLELTLHHFCKLTGEFGMPLATSPDHDYPWAFCRSSAGWSNLLVVLSADIGWLKRQGDGNYTVTVKGWERYQDGPHTTGDVGFIAMSFDTKLNALQAAIERAIDRSGYRPLRIDGDLYNGGIVDRIVAQIRRSSFVVADLTQNRGGVYYEAGFARALGMEVFLTSDASQLADATPDRVHFDVAHLHIVTWEPGKLDLFTENLRARIEAVIGRGPRTETDNTSPR